MIEVKNIIIRPLQMGDEDYLYNWWNNGELMEHATHKFGVLQSKESIKNSVINELEGNQLFPTNKRFIICNKDDLKPIGEVNYCDYDARNQKAELGIKICELDEHGNGKGKDALYHFIDFMFKFLNLNKIELTTMADNKRAQRLYEKLGFKKIGVIREAYFDSRCGEFSDVIYMDLLKKDWTNARISL